MEHVDQARMELFFRENKTMENIPPTLNDLLQKRPTPGSWGWKWDECGMNELLFGPPR